MNWSIGQYPLSSGSAGRSARPSVIGSFVTAVTSTPVSALRQPSSRIGFPSGSFGNKAKRPCFSRAARVVSTTESGFVPKAVTHPDTGFRRPGFDYLNSSNPSVGLKRSLLSTTQGMKRAMSVSRRAHSCGPDSDESGHPIGLRCVPCATTKRSQSRRRCSVAGGGWCYRQTFTPVLRGYESTVVGRCGLRGREPQFEPRHGHGACPRAAKARPADAVPPLSNPPSLRRSPKCAARRRSGCDRRRLFLTSFGIGVHS